MDGLLVHVFVYYDDSLLHLKQILFKVSNTYTRTRCEICSKLTMKIPERRYCRRSGIFIVNFERYWRRSGIFIDNFEHISHLALMFLLLTLSR